MIRSKIHRFRALLSRSYDVFNRIEVSRSALLHNAQFFHQTTGKEVIPVLKGNAYGHGIAQVATALRGQHFPYIAVDGYFEALKVREVNRQPILVMGMIKPHNFPKLRLQGLTFVVQDEATIRALAQTKKRIKIHLELNTGMNRYGIRPDEVPHYLDLLGSTPQLQLEGVMTHLADSDGTKKETIEQAVTAYDAAVDTILARGFTPRYFHVAQSAGSVRAQSRHANAIRVGLGLYGINPFPKGHPSHAQCNDLRPALKLVSTISKIQVLQPGDKVSYNYTFTAKKPMRIGILPLGYHEGVQRALSNAGVVKAGDAFAPIVGRVCMNHTMVDTSGLDLAAGTEVTVYSNLAADPNSIESIAHEHGLFAYSILTGLSPDVRRYLVE